MLCPPCCPHMAAALSGASWFLWPMPRLSVWLCCHSLSGSVLRSTPGEVRVSLGCGRAIGRWQEQGLSWPGPVVRHRNLASTQDVVSAINQEPRSSFFFLPSAVHY